MGDRPAASVKPPAAPAAEMEESPPSSNFLGSLPLGWCLVLTGLTLGLLPSLVGSRRRSAELPQVRPHYRIDINTASQQEWEVLPEIGAALAQRIVHYRQTNGPFADCEALLQVSGVGPKTLERLRPMLTRN
ncbi:MAG: helix-hairpin-helix domain-containing protein [Planctomycetales bacterium]|nr:helix-hairpin-helix domain-containing protein [Planctomycetales bacterium]